MSKESFDDAMAATRHALGPGAVEYARTMDDIYSNPDAQRRIVLEGKSHAELLAKAVANNNELKAAGYDKSDIFFASRGDTRPQLIEKIIKFENRIDADTSVRPPSPVAAAQQRRSRVRSSRRPRTGGKRKRRRKHTRKRRRKHTRKRR